MLYFFVGEGLRIGAHDVPAHAALELVATQDWLLTNTGEDLYDATRRSRELRPQFFAYRELQGGTHDIVDEQPGPWVEAVTAFCRRHGFGGSLPQQTRRLAHASPYGSEPPAVD